MTSVIHGALRRWNYRTAMLFAVACFLLLAPSNSLIAHGTGTSSPGDSVARPGVPRDGRVSLGITGGFSISGFHGERASDEFTTRVSFHANARFRTFVGRHFGVQGEFRYARRGGTLEREPGTRLFRLDYIEFSPMLLARPAPQGAIEFYIAAGPVLAWNVNALVDIEHGSIRETLHLTDVGDFDYGAAVEIGTVLDVGALRCLAAVAYTAFPNAIQERAANTVQLANNGFLIHFGIML